MNISWTWTWQKYFLSQLRASSRVYPPWLGLLTSPWGLGMRPSSSESDAIETLSRSLMESESSVESDWNHTVWWEVREGIGMISCAMGVRDLCWTPRTMGVWDRGWGQTSCRVGVLDRWGTSWVRIDEGFGVEINSVWSVSVGSIGVWGPAS